MLNKYVKVSDKFNSSVNLNYDLNNEEKINNFIPTNDLCDVIKMYLKIILGETSSKSINLVGPYGKGKSYLLLVLSYIVSNSLDDNAVYNNLVNKISIIDQETALLIRKLNDSKIKLLPVVINNQFEDVNQSFLLALTNTLEMYELKNIIPKTIFNNCLDTIAKWEIETKKNKNLDIYQTCLNELNIELNQLKSELNSFSTSSLEKFKKIFKCVTYGLEFAPLITNDIATIFNETNEQIITKGYSGMFVIFDEFSVFLSTHNNNLRENMLKIQKFSELATNNFKVNNQITFTVVTHQKIDLYDNNESNSVKDAFRAIEGRFSTIRFERSLDENYLIFGSALLKTKLYKNYLIDFKNKNDVFINNLKNTFIFDNDFLNYLIENTLPFNPLTLYLLIKISEIIAQNERTLFTFLQDNDKNGFNYFIKNNDINNIINSDIVYDYFELTIKENPFTKDIYQKVFTTNKFINNEIEKKIIKTLGLIYINNDFIKLAPTKENISLLLNLDLTEIEKALNNLENKLFIKTSILDNLITFTVSTNTYIESEVNNLINTTLTKPLSYYLNNIFEDKIIKSSRYNFEYSMFRFYENVFIESSSLQLLNDFNSVTNNFNDGLIINILEDEKIDKDKLKEISENIIFRKFKSKFNTKMIKLIKSYFAYELILTKKDIDQLLKVKVEMLKEESFIESNKIIQHLFDNCYYLYDNKKETNINNLMYKSLTSTFTNTVILRNEAINRNILTKTSEKALINVLNKLLGFQYNEYSETSQDGTIEKSFLTSLKLNESKHIIELLKDEFKKTIKDKVPFSNLISKLTIKPYGIRKGVLSLFLAQAISELNITNNNSNTLLITQGKVELVISGELLNKIVKNPELYQFKYLKINNEKINYISELFKLYSIDQSSNLLTNLNDLTNKIKNELLNLPRITLDCSIKNNDLNLNVTSIKFKEEFMKPDLNNYNVFFEVLPTILEVEYVKIPALITKIKKDYSTKLDKYMNNVKDELISKFGKAKADLKTNYELWLKKHIKDEIVFKDNIQVKLHKTFKELGYNDIDSLNSLVIATLGNSVYNWSLKQKNEFFNCVNNYIEYVESYNVKNKEKINTIEINELSVLAKTLKNNLEDTIEDYADSVNNIEKVAILESILKELKG